MLIEHRCGPEGYTGYSPDIEEYVYDAHDELWLFEVLRQYEELRTRWAEMCDVPDDEDAYILQDELDAKWDARFRRMTYRRMFRGRVVYDADLDLRKSRGF